MTDQITIPRALLEQALEALWQMTKKFNFERLHESRLSDSNVRVSAHDAMNAIRAELAKPVGQSETEHEDELAVNRFAARMKWKLANARARGKSGWQDRSWTPEQISAALRQHVDKGDPVDVANYCMFLADRNEPITPSPAQHDAPDVVALKAERDALLKLINRRKIHPHDFPLEIFIADLSTRTANVLRAEFNSFRHTAGTYDIEPPFTVRHLLMFSRQEIKKWPGIGKKGLNEIEENLRARGLQLWHAHDDRSLRLLREHKSYFVDHAKAEGVAA